ncbi:MAG: helix-turn-helix domain-containing protein [Ezakiella sp.]|nr:helix-turn-helix domain-containing protein [Ezakiella sp.]MDD7472096.1 S24 family peptidase [Bacillota bacterium]
MSIGDNIKKRRVELGMSVEDLANKINKNRATIYRYENKNIENLPTTILEPLAKALKTTPAELMGWEVKSNKLPSQTYKLLPNTAGAGLMDYELDISELETIDVPDQFLGRYAGRKDILILKVNGESMNKIIPDQSYVGIIYKDYDYLPQTGDIIVYRLRGEGLGIKRFIDMYDEIMLKPESTEQIYKERRFKKETADDFEILGKVIMYNVTLD